MARSAKAAGGRSRAPPGRARVVEVYVYEVPVRLWHWTNALAMAVLMATGYLIGAPGWPTPAGEASGAFLMGYVRFLHFAAGYVFAVGLAGRAYWALAGNRWARELFHLPLRDRHWWRGVVAQWRWYLFLGREPGPYVGHDPLAQLVMVLGFTLPAGFMVLTGFALYSEGTGQGGWMDALFGWVLPLLGHSLDVHAWHRLGMWVLACFTLVHVYAALREELMASRSLLSVVITGYRQLHLRGRR